MKPIFSRLSQQHGKRQAGVSIAGLVVAIAVVGAVGLVAAQAVPAYTENMSIRKIVNDLRYSTATDAKAVRSEFAKQASVAYVESISADDLEITRDGGSWVISYSYEKRIPIVANVSMLIEFAE